MLDLFYWIAAAYVYNWCKYNWVKLSSPGATQYNRNTESDNTGTDLTSWPYLALAWPRPWTHGVTICTRQVWPHHRHTHPRLQTSSVSRICDSIHILLWHTFHLETDFQLTSQVCLIYKIKSQNLYPSTGTLQWWAKVVYFWYKRPSSNTDQ